MFPYLCVSVSLGRDAVVLAGGVPVLGLQTSRFRLVPFRFVKLQGVHELKITQNEINERVEGVCVGMILKHCTKHTRIIRDIRNTYKSKLQFSVQFKTPQIEISNKV